jgi:CheY-like chemotaxis protein
VALRVPVVDDPLGFRRLTRLLLAAGDSAVVRGVANGLDALVQAALLHPDVVLLPDLDGFAAAERLADLPRFPAVVLVSGEIWAELGRRPDIAPEREFLPEEELTLDWFTTLAG